MPLKFYRDEVGREPTGAPPTGPTGPLTLDKAKAAVESNFWGVYRVAREAKIRGGGSLTFVSDSFLDRPIAYSTQKRAINAALEAFACGLALELSPIRVNTVSPGVIDTPLDAPVNKVDRQDLLDRTASRLPVRRIGQPQDIAQALLFVATNPHGTGSTVTVDGGGTIA